MSVFAVTSAYRVFSRINVASENFVDVSVVVNTTGYALIYLELGCVFVVVEIDFELLV